MPYAQRGIAGGADDGHSLTARGAGMDRRWISHSFATHAFQDIPHEFVIHRRSCIRRPLPVQLEHSRFVLNRQIPRGLSK